MAVISMGSGGFDSIMRIGKRIDGCPFIPLVITYPKLVNYEEIQAELSPERRRVNLFFLAQSTYEIPPENDYAICHMKHLRDVGSENYSSLVDVMFDIIKVLSEPDESHALIGIVSRRTPDLACYFIVQWLINEKGIRPETALSLVAESLPPGITKRKYIHKLNHTYGIALNESIEFVHIPVPMPVLEKPKSELIPRSCTPDAPMKRVASGRIEQAELKAADALLNEVYAQCHLPIGRLPLKEYVQITRDAIDRIANDTENEYCLMLEPDGDRCIMFLKAGKCFLFYENRKNLFVHITYTFTGTAVIEGSLVKTDEGSTFVMSDLLSLNSEKMDERPFNVRIALLEDEILSTWNPAPDDTISLAIRPFYHMSSYEKLMDVFTKKQIFKRYPVKGLTVSPISGAKSVCYSWSINPPKPRVIIRADYRSGYLYGHATTKSTNIVVAFLGPVTPETNGLNGRVAEIEVVNKNHIREDLVTGEVLREAQDSEPWSISDFWRFYPDQNPHFKTEQMKDALARIAQMPHYK